MLAFSRLLSLLTCLCVVRAEVHYKLHARAENVDGSPAVYKDASASIEDRIADLLPRMTLEEKVSQL